ncbi:MAG: glutathionylspermidine synthase family protein [Telmatospirillum sp.]|nr:glutathionylspermidine synthase family protein [Telmatospirillum sp.]
MRRERVTPRPDWPARVEALGLSFHSEEGVPYWCEEACYSFTAAEIDRIEEDTARLHELCLTAAGRLITGGDLDRLGIGEHFWPWIARSWDRSAPDLYGRFDLAYDGSGPAKLLEYNADTPTALLEAAVIQWYWLEETRPAADQFNSIHERLIDRWRTIGSGLPAGQTLHFAGVTAEAEDLVTLDYLRDTCEQAGLATRLIDIADIGWNGRTFTDLEEQPVQALFKLYPWEWMLREGFAAHLTEDRTLFLEPPWKMVLSTKAILPILWEMFPGHPNLLPAVFRRGDLPGRCVEKPFHGREGSGIRFLDPGAAGAPEGQHVWQAVPALPRFDGRHALVGSWVIGGEPAGIGLREDPGLVTGNQSLFLPHYLKSW